MSCIQRAEGEREAAEARAGERRKKTQATGRGEEAKRGRREAEKG